MSALTRTSVPTLLTLICISVFSVVRANADTTYFNTDTLALNSSWRWISFPRLQRYTYADDPFPSVPVMKNTTLFPDFEFNLHSQLEGSKYYDPSGYPNQWSGQLGQVKSTLGYKYEVPPADLPQPKQILKGAKLYPDCPVLLPGPGAEKWIGYFIEESQYPWDAFPPEIYNGVDGLTMIKAQYWTMHKIASPDGSSGWLISGKVTPIKYGDMVIVKYNGTESSFVWNNPNEPAENMSIPEPEAYTWDEKADYTPFYVETDSSSDIQEIAVTVDGECMGATVREPGDTLVEVDGYLGALPGGEEVEFETWNGTKSTPVKGNGYVVYNPSTRQKEKRTIYVGEQQDYYLVSLKADEVYNKPDDISQLSCKPNPFRNETTLTLRLNSSQHIAVDVYNIQGAKVKTLLDSDLPGGYYEVVWKGDNESGNKVNEGVYFVKLKTANGTEITNKLVLTK